VPSRGYRHSHRVSDCSVRGDGSHK
jgi:Protein of unknown function (DUF3363)